MYPPTEQVRDHSQINFSVLLFQRKWISASSAFQRYNHRNHRIIGTIWIEKANMKINVPQFQTGKRL